MSETTPSPDGLGLKPVETRAPDGGRSMESALAEMRRRAEQAAPPVSQPVVPYVQTTVPSSQAVAPMEPPPAPALPPPDAVMEPPASQAAGGGGGSADHVVQLEIDGQLVPVTLAELQRGYLREQDYRRKTQQTAEQLRKAQEMQAAFQHARTQLEARLPQFVSQHQAEFGVPIDWEKLSKEDPIGTTQKVARLLAMQQALQEQENLRQLKQNEETGRKNQLMAIGHDVLCRLIPGWSDAPTRRVIQAALGAHAVSMGYPPEQVQSAEVLDPREIFMCWKSMNYDRLMAQRVLPQPVGQRTIEGPGVHRRQPGGAPSLQEAEDRFRQSGRMEDALQVARLRREAANGAAQPPPPPQPLSRWR